MRIFLDFWAKMGYPPAFLVLAIFLETFLRLAHQLWSCFFVLCYLLFTNIVLPRMFDIYRFFPFLFYFKYSNYIKQYIQWHKFKISYFVNIWHIQFNPHSVAIHNYGNTTQQLNHNKSVPIQSKAIRSYDIVTIEASINTMLWINK